MIICTNCGGIDHPPAPERCPACGAADQHREADLDRDLHDRWPWKRNPDVMKLSHRDTYPLRPRETA